MDGRIIQSIFSRKEILHIHKHTHTERNMVQYIYIYTNAYIHLWDIFNVLGDSLPVHWKVNIERERERDWLHCVCVLTLFCFVKFAHYFISVGNLISANHVHSNDCPLLYKYLHLKKLNRLPYFLEFSRYEKKVPCFSSPLEV